MKTLLLLFLSTFGLTAGQSISFKWDSNSETNVVSYRMYSGPAAGVYTVTNTIAGRTNNTFTATNTPPGQSFWAVAAVDASGLESDLSNEVSWTNRPAPPKALRLSVSVQSAASLNGPWSDITLTASNTQFEIARSRLIQTTNMLTRFYRPRIGIEEVQP